MFCKYCGNNFEGSFCRYCGKENKRTGRSDEIDRLMDGSNWYKRLAADKIKSADSQKEAAGTIPDMKKNEPVAEKKIVKKEEPAPKEHEKGEAGPAIKGKKATYKKKRLLSAAAVVSLICGIIVSSSLTRKKGYDSGYFAGYSAGAEDARFELSNMYDAMMEETEKAYEFKMQEQFELGYAEGMSAAQEKESERKGLFSPKKRINFNLVQPEGKNNLILTVQERLNEEGWNLKTDGIFGKQTATALKEFQDRSGLEANGKVDYDTLDRLFR